MGKSPANILSWNCLKLSFFSNRRVCLLEVWYSPWMESPLQETQGCPAWTGLISRHAEDGFQQLPPCVEPKASPSWASAALGTLLRHEPGLQWCESLGISWFSAFWFDSESIFRFKNDSRFKIDFGFKIFHSKLILDWIKRRHYF